MQIPFTNRYVTLGEDFYTRTPPTPVEKPELIAFNGALAGELGERTGQSEFRFHHQLRRAFVVVVPEIV